MFPKPKYQKIQKIKTSSLFTESEWAYQKGKEKHHICGGPNRKLPDYKKVISYYGSSVYDSREMSILINEIVDQVKGLDIETMTPEELNALNEEWESKNEQDNVLGAGSHGSLDINNVCGFLPHGSSQRYLELEE